MEILVPASCNGTECPSPSALFESQTCEVSETIDCQLSEWTIWSACSENCGQGTMERSRWLLTPAYCGGAHCLNKTLEESTTCESFSASRDCRVRKIFFAYKIKENWLKFLYYTKKWEFPRTGLTLILFCFYGKHLTSLEQFLLNCNVCGNFFGFHWIPLCRIREYRHT